MRSQKQEIEQLKTEIDYYKSMLKWYRDTYETRSIFGIVKDKVNQKIKNRLNLQQRIRLPKYRRENNHRIQQTLIGASDQDSFYASHKMDENLYRIGIFIHLYYHDLWHEISGYLKGMGINFDLHISLNEGDENCDYIIEEIKKDFPNAYILKVPNKGLDVGPFFELINNAINRRLHYDFVLKFHTKKSLGVDAEVGETWRRKSYESLMGSQSIVFHILRLFKSRHTIGMIGPYESRMSASINDISQNGNANALNIEKLAEKLHIKDRSLDFFGGTMFWVRWSIFEEKFKKHTLSVHDFEPGYKHDELLSHAMERLFASIVRDAKFELYELHKTNDYLFYKKQKRRICWVHPGFGIGGGNRVIFEICKEQQKYYEVISVSYFGRPYNNWMDLNHRVLYFSNEIKAKHFIETQGIDYVFATGWQTVDFVKKITNVQKKFYFIQDYEPWFADAQADLAKASYNNSFQSNIVIASWLKNKLYHDHKLKSVFVKLGTRTYPCNNLQTNFKSTQPLKVLVYFKLKSHKGRGSDLVLMLLKKLSNNTNIEVHVFGHEDPNVDGVNFHGELFKDKLQSLYRSSDVFVDLSRHRGIATIALEVAQFGVVSLLSAKDFGLEEYGFIDNENCLLVQDVEDAYNKINLLANNPEKYKDLKTGIISLSKSFNWEYTVNDFNQVVDLLT